MKEPIIIPADPGYVFGYTYSNRKVEQHRITRYGVLDGCSLPTISAVGPDGRRYQSSPSLLHDTALEAIREEEQVLASELDEINGQMGDLVRVMGNAMFKHAIVIEQLVAEANKEKS